MTEVESVRNADERTLLIDCGGIVPTRRVSLTAKKMITDIGLRAMDQMGYACMNLGGIDFSLGVDFLKKVTSDLNFPIVTSNLVYREGGLHFGKEYVIVGSGGIKVGILGVMPLDVFENKSAELIGKSLEIIPPEKALTFLIPELKKKTDVIVLLSQCGIEATNLLLENLDGIDLAIIAGIKDDEYVLKKAPCGGQDGEKSFQTDSKTLIMQASSQGESLGLARLTLNGDGQIIKRQGEMIAIDKSVVSDERIASITGDDIYVTVRQEREKRKEKREKEIIQEFEKLRRMTPEEYKEYIQKEPVKRGEMEVKYD